MATECATPVQVQYCTACRLVTPKRVLSGRLEVLGSGGRPWCLHFAGEEDVGEEMGKDATPKVRFPECKAISYACAAQDKGRNAWGLRAVVAAC